MALKKYFVCDGCDVEELADYVPDGWQQVKIEIDGRSLSTHDLSVERDLCARCLTRLTNSADPCRWPRAARSGVER